MKASAELHGVLQAITSCLRFSHVVDIVGLGVIEEDDAESAWSIVLEICQAQGFLINCHLLWEFQEIRIGTCLPFIRMFGRNSAADSTKPPPVESTELASVNACFCRAHGHILGVPSDAWHRAAAYPS